MSLELSIIIPAFNAEETVGATVRSAFAQSGAAVEVIVVDDGSADGTARAARLAGPVTMVRQRNAGLAGARNAGLAMARAPLVTFLDADDRLDPDFARAMIPSVRGFDLAACLTRMVGPALEDLGWTIRPSPADLSIEGLAAFNPLAIGSIVWRRAALERLGLVDRSAEGFGAELFERRWPCHEDWNLIRRAVFAGARFAPIVPRALFDYRIRPGSMSTRLREMHEVGLRVIEAGPGPRGPVPCRAWTLRSLARALAAGDEALARELGGAVRELNEQEAGLVRGAVEHALGLGAARAPWNIEGHAHRERLSRACAAASVAGLERTLAGVPFQARDVARAIRDLLRPGEELVLAGMGRRGWALAEALGAMTPALWLDDAPGARGPAGSRRIARADLTGRHVVIITPASADSIRASLSVSPARVISVEDLLCAA